MRHVGDLGNLYTSDDGVTNVNIVDCLITLDESSPAGILNRAFVVHGGEDDLGLGGNAGSIGSGNAGARLGCGIILEKMPCKF